MQQNYPSNTRVTLRLTPEQYAQYKKDPLKYLGDFRKSLAADACKVALND